jgi:cell division protein FtsL
MIRTSQVLFWFGLTIAASLALYHTSDRVHDLSQQLREINASIDAEQQSIHVLKAEWVYLANPARVESTAKKYLALRPTSPQQVTRIDDLAEIVPTRKEAMTSVAVSATPIANIRTSLAMPPRTVPLPKHKATITVAAVDSGHINDHMIMQRTASAQPLPDSIGAMLNELGTHP